MVDVEHLHVLPSVSAFLGIDKKLVTIDHVLTQLRFAATANVDKFQYEELEKLKQLCLESYKYLQTAVDNEEIGEERIHQEIKTIFIEGKFVDADQVAFDLARDCQPYLYRLPEEIAVRFERLMLSLIHI